MNLIKKCVLRLALYFVYGMIGSWLFCLIEKRDETYSTTGNRLLENLREKMAKIYNLTNSTDFDEFVSEAFEAIVVSRQTDWTFLTGCGFAFAALTTVGYGDMSPKTSLGKGFLIPYCLIGLPITMLALKTSGELTHLAIKNAAFSFEKKVLRRQQYEKKLIKCFLIIISIIIVVICAVAGLEVVFEGWAFLDGVYCWFVTLTTIGFGDYVPFKYYREKNKHSSWRVYLTGILFTFPFIVGLCLVSGLLDVLMQGSENIKVHFHKICSCSKQRTSVSQTDVNEEDNKVDINLQPYGIREQKHTSCEM